MLANVFHGPGDLRLERLPIPEVGPGGLLIRVRAASVCASDVRVFKGEKGAKPGTILGHEMVGEVAEAGAEVSEFRQGDRVTVYPVIACGACFFCQRGHRNMCLNRRTIGYNFNGAFAEYMHIPGDVVNLGNVVGVPGGLSDEEAALTEPLACSINGVEVLGLETGETLLVLGSGPMGLILTAVARVSGAGRIIVSEVSEERLRFAGEMGADVLVNPTREDLASRVMDETGGLGVDAAIVTVGAAGVVEEALKTVRKEGRVCLFAGFPPGSELRIDPNAIHYRMIRLTASQSATLTQFRRGLTLMSTGRVDLKPLVTHRFPLDEVNRAIEKRIALEGLKPEIFPGLKRGG